jgi:hypothetical protein
MTERLKTLFCRVSVSGIRGSPPPSTTKLAVCTIGGYQLDSSMFAVGLDIEGKLEAFRDMIRLTPNAKDYSVLRIDSYGTAQVNPKSQFDATVRFRIFAQAEKAETLLTLGTTVMAHALGGFCGLHGNIDPRPVNGPINVFSQTGRTKDVCRIYSIHSSTRKAQSSCNFCWQ